ncbi:MAG: hypothetical protein IJL54_02955 [Prevotella sp.]|nr:hypothetical protein [Prevotella sp.]
MKTDRYISPAIKVHVPSCNLLQIGVGSGPNEGPIESKGNSMFEEDDQTEMWGKVWGRVDGE